MDGTTARPDRRGAPRRSVLKRAQLAAGDAVLDCVLLDSSETGARVHLAEGVTLPRRVELRFPGGLTVQAVSRWIRGAEYGLEYALETAGREEGPGRAWLAALSALRAGRLDQAVRQLRAEHFLGDAELRRAAEEAEAACHRLEAALRQRAKTGAN